MDATAKLFGSATQVNYDYQPLTLDQLIARSSTIVTGPLVSVRGIGNDESSTSTLFEITIERTYKGPLDPGQRLVMQTSRAPYISTRDLKDIENKLRGQSVTLFLQPATAVRPSEVAQGVDVFWLTTPQGLVVTSACGLRQAFDNAPFLGAEVDTAEELDATLRAAQ